MMKIVLALFVVSFHLHAAQKHTGTIEYIDEAKSPEELTHLYISDGFVLKDPDTLKRIDEYEEAKNEKYIIEFSVDENRRILSVSVIGKKILHPQEFYPGTSFEPTVLSSEAEAKNVFKSLRRGALSWSQCYNRAHVWAYESLKKFNLNSMKMFIFYTRKYIREYDFQWWFHVAPYTYVKIQEANEQRILDRTFAREPLAVKSWTDIFMKNKVDCSVITKYSDYENHQESQYCYLYKASMYYLQPLDLENHEQTGATKTKWLDYEVSRAYWNGFGM